MALDEQVDLTREGEPKASESNALSLFVRSAHYELHQSAFGLAQSFGLSELVGKMETPPQAKTEFGEHAQILGRGLGSFLPALAVALTAKYGIGKVMAVEPALASENLLLKRSSIGLNVVESAATGLVTGALLKPTDDMSAMNWQSFASDRLESGAANALAFSALTLTSFAWGRLASTRPFTSTGLDHVFKNATVAGALSGALGGVANVEADSLLREGKFATDEATLKNSAYEMAVVGGLFGLTASGLSWLRSARARQQQFPVAESMIAEQAQSRRLLLQSGRVELSDKPFLQRAGEVLPSKYSHLSGKELKEPVYQPEFEYHESGFTSFGKGLSREGASATELNSDRLFALESLKERFGHEPEVVERILGVSVRSATW